MSLHMDLHGLTDVWLITMHPRHMPRFKGVASRPPQLACRDAQSTGKLARCMFDHMSGHGLTG